jgi:acyl carrier protein
MTPLQETPVLSRLQQRLPRFGGHLDPDVALRELGLDSMDTVELLCAIHEEFGVSLTQTEFQPDATLHDLAALIAAKLNSNPS